VEHKEFFIGADDEGANGGNGGKGFRNGVAFKEFGDSKHVRGDMVGQSFLEFGEGVVAGEDSAGADAAVAGGGDVVIHVANKEGLFRPEIVIFENAVDGIPFVGHAGIGFAEEVVHAQTAGLVLEVGLVNGAEKKNGEFAGVTVFEDLARSGQKGDGVMKLPENLPENFLELVEGGVGNVLFVEAFVGEVELFPKGLTVEGGFAVGGENAVGGLQDGGEVVHEGAGPIEDEVADHFFEATGDRL